MVRRISSSRPITGSSLPLRANSVKSMVYFLSASRWPSTSGASTLAPPRTASIAACIATLFKPCWRANLPASDLSSHNTNKTISDAKNWSPRFSASFSAKLNKLLVSRPNCTSPPLPDTLAILSMAALSDCVNAATLTPARCSNEFADISASFKSANNKWGGSI